MDLKTALNNTRTVYPRFPKEELEYILSHGDEAVPHLIERLKIAAELDYAGDMEYIIFPLAQLRIHEATEYLLTVLTFDEEDLEWQLGDILTDGFCSILASCATADDIPAIKEIILNDDLYEFARSAALSALNIMFAQGRVKRDELIAFYDKLFTDCSDNGIFMTSAICDCATLHFDELSDKIKIVFDSGVVEFNETWEGFQKTIAETTRENALEKFKEERFGCFVDSAIEAMAWWPVFQEGVTYDFGRKIGPNELCPCGSEKKFKKCCRLRVR